MNTFIKMKSQKKIEVLQNRIKNLEEAKCTIENEIDNLKYNIIEYIYNYIKETYPKEKIEEIEEEIEKELEPRDLFLSHWECKDSPTGHCIMYDSPIEDTCIICGEPDERK